MDKAHSEYANYKDKRLNEPSAAEIAFLEATEKELMALENKRRLSSQ
jgi:hypothetical protein